MAPKKRSGSRRRMQSKDSEARTLSRPDHRPDQPTVVLPPLVPRPQDRSVSSASSSAAPVNDEIRPDDEFVHAVHAETIAGDERSVETIYALICSGEDVNQCSAVLGFTPLIVAAAAGNDSLVALLLEKKADPTATTLDKKELPLHIAARLGHKIVCQLLAGPTAAAGVIDVNNNAGWCPLHIAAVAGLAQIVRVLLSARSNPNTPAAFHHGHRTALHFAAFAGHTETLEELLEVDANVNGTDHVGLAPLHLAASRGHDRCTSLLLRFKADASLRGGPGDNLPIELVPQENPSSEKILRILSAYARAVTPMRTDARFDIPGSVPPHLIPEIVETSGPCPRIAKAYADSEALWL